MLREAALKKRTDGKDWVDALLDRALTDKDPALALKIVDKLFASVTPEAPGLVANNSLEGLLARLQGGTDESPDDDDVHAPALNGGQPS